MRRTRRLVTYVGDGLIANEPRLGLSIVGGSSRAVSLSLFRTEGMVVKSADYAI